MSQHALFYNSVGGDRKYDAESFSELFSKFFTTGVFNGDLTVSVSSQGGMNVDVAPGYINIGGKVMNFETTTQLSLDIGGGTYPRIDTIVVERNDIDRDFTLKVVKGGYASNPSPIPPVRSADVWQMVLAQVYVGIGETSVSNANITDKRGDSSVCGIVTATVEQMDFSAFERQFNEWQTQERDDFEAWVQTLQGILDSQTAGHLQLEIDNANDRIDDLDTTVQGLDSDVDTLDGKVATIEPQVNTNTSNIETINSKLLEKLGGFYAERNSTTYNAIINATSWANVRDVIPNVGDEIYISTTGADAQKMNNNGLIPFRTGGLFYFSKPLDNFLHVRYYSGAKMIQSNQFSTSNAPQWYEYNGTLLT